MVIYVTSKIKLGFLGVAHFHADSYAQSLKTLPQVEVVGVFDKDKSLAISFAQKFSIERHDKAEKLINNVDAVVITSENVYHYEYVTMAAEAGKHILCEKPMTVNLREADEIVTLVEKKKVVFQMCYVMRYHTVTSLVRELITEGRIGKLLVMVGTNKLNRSLPLLRPWFTDKSLSGGGAVMDHTVHLADLMRWYSSSEVVEVYTEVGKNANSNLSVEDNFLTTVIMENGTIGHIDGSWTYSSGHYTWGDVTMELLGSEGVLYIDAFRQAIYLVSNEKPDDKLIWHYYGCNADLMLVKDFVRCILENNKPRANVYDGRQGVAVTLASYESSTLGRPVRLG